MIHHGEVRWYEFNHPDKKRPVVVLTRDSIIPYLNEVSIAPITRTVRNIPTEVTLGHEQGMKSECVINLDHIQTVAKSNIGSLITVLNRSKLHQIKEALLFAFDME
jgi:mRNA interferase MazF